MTSNDTAVIASDRLGVEVDPRRGGCIRSIVDRHTGVELLFQASWSGEQAAHRAKSHEGWVEQWVGGWHALAPNAGEACEVDGRLHRFHGDASTERWEIQARSPAGVFLTWTDRDGLVFERRVEVCGHEVNVATQVLNASDTDLPFVLVEHLIFSLSALGADVELTMPRGRLQALADDGTPLAGPAALERWPQARTERGASDWSYRAPPGSSRFGTLRDMPVPVASIHAPSTGLVVELEWSETFPYLWYWEENGGAAEAPWDGRVSCLGLEPAVCATSEGLGRALAAGDAAVLPPASSRSFAVSLRVRDIDMHTAS